MDIPALGFGELETVLKQDGEMLPLLFQEDAGGR